MSAEIMATRHLSNARMGPDGRITSDYIPCDKPHRLGRCMEFMRVEGKDYCLFCLGEAVEARMERCPPWFGSSSPHGADIIALGVAPFRVEVLL